MVKVLRILFVLCTVSVANAQDAREIVRHYVDTVSAGDIRNWNKITKMYYEGLSYYSQNDFEQKTNLVNPDQPNYVRTYLDIKSQKSKYESFSDSSFEIRTSVFYFLPDKIIILMGNLPPVIKRAPSEIEPFVSPHLAVYVSKILEHSKSVELVGEKAFQPGGGSFYELVLTAKGKRYYVFINTETFLLEYYNFVGDGDRAHLVRVDEYEKFGNLLIPMFEATTRNNVTFHWTRKLKLVLNPELHSSIFEYIDK